VTDAIPATPKTPVPIPEREYVVLSGRCVYGAVGELVTLTLTDNQELSLLQSGAVKRAPVPPPAKAEPPKPERPTPTVLKKGK